MLTIIMYHYVRDLHRSRYPRIKGLTIEKFEGQLDYIMKHYKVCSLKEIISIILNGDSLPSRSILLTFDDGFLDHYLNVFPRLDERGLVGSFFPPAKAILEHRVLDTHKIHFILASTEDHRKLIEDIFRLIKPYREQYKIPEDKDLYKMFATEGRYDAPPVVFIKKVLQKELPNGLRLDVIDRLFAEYVNVDEESFAKELYLDVNQLSCMVRHGMDVGGHGYTHRSLEGLAVSEQINEVERTIGLLKSVYGHAPSNWAMSYPYGTYDRTTLELLEKTGCMLGLTTSVGLVADLSRPLELNRLNTNDLPFKGDENPCEWTKKIQRASV
jgi:peptidoglycan/xylan/chitin deacetylase (PgdA/CDA1 family)